MTDDNSESKCPICEKNFGNDYDMWKKAVTSPCNHTFCQSCLLNRLVHFEKPLCPKCTNPISSVCLKSRKID